MKKGITMETVNILKTQKNKIIEIINEFERYYNQNHKEWSIKDISASHQILGTLMLTYKKVESMEQALQYFKQNDLMELFNIELEEVNIITDYYEGVFIKKGA